MRPMRGIDTPRLDKYPFPPKAKIELAQTWFPINGTTGWPVWMDNYGEDGVLILAANWDQNRLFRSVDNGETWSEIWFRPVGDGVKVRAIGTENPDENRSVLLVRQGGREVWISSDLTSNDHTKWEPVLTAEAGYFSHHFGFSVHKNVILLSTYGSGNSSNPPRFVFLSRDYGETWETIFEADPQEMASPGEYHIHDVEYDPWSNRIWVAIGDNTNTNTMYSDDWGSTWNSVFTERQGHYTTITALPDRVIFGTDDQTNGVWVWYRPPHQKRAQVTADDIVPLFTAESYLINRVSYAIKPLTPTYLQSAPGSPGYVVPFTRSHEGGTGRLLASPDGERWHEIFLPEIHDAAWRDMQVHKFVGPVPNDPNGYMYWEVTAPGIPYVQNKGMLRISMPEWVSR